MAFRIIGQVSEWFKEHAWKACVGETLPWVRIPPCPPFIFSGSRAKRAAGESEFRVRGFDRSWNWSWNVVTGLAAAEERAHRTQRADRTHRSEAEINAVRHSLSLRGQTIVQSRTRQQGRRLEGGRFHCLVVGEKQAHL